MGATPRITIGLPVYNGAATIEASMESLLAQTFDDFELVVSDNCSTDSTGEVVQALAARDSRVRYVRQPENIGANGNYSYLATVARGEYLKWASASDLCAPTFLQSCVALLEADPTAVLAAPRTRLFEVTVADALDYTDDIELLDESPYARFRSLTNIMKLNNAMNGLIRRESLLRTRLIEPFRGADVVMMGQLALLGRFRLVDAPLFYRRMDPKSATLLQTNDAVRRHHYPQMSIRALFQHFRWQMGWLRAAATAPVRPKDRLQALLWAARMGYWQRAGLYLDLKDALRYLCRMHDSTAARTKE